MKIRILNKLKKIQLKEQKIKKVVSRNPKISEKKSKKKLFKI